MKVHFVGIGGIGLSSLARHFLSHKVEVSGSDMHQSVITDALQKDGAKIHIGHKVENLDPKTELVVFSDAIPAQNPELKKAKELKIKTKSYFEQLGQVSKNFATTIIAGTHGKSTTTAMLAQILVENDKDPAVFLGTLSNVLDGKNYRAGEKIALIEACEYRENFLHLYPQNILLLNAEPEHLDFFKTDDRYFDAFWKLAPKGQEGAFVIANLDDLNIGSIVARLAADAKHQIVTYGTQEGVDFRSNYRQEKKLLIYNLADELISEITLQVPGWHNRQNALAAFAAATTFGVDKESIKKSLENFSGTWRRLENKGEKDGITIFDDYAHHPTEIKASLAALKESFPDKKIFSVFQPHQFSRTHLFLDELAKSFNDAHEVIVTEIYQSRDKKEDLEKVSATNLVEAIKREKSTARLIDSFAATLEYLKKELKKGDILVTMGAGNIYEVAERFK